MTPEAKVPRLWTISTGVHGYGFSASPGFPWGEEVKVIEAEPVADLLERLHGPEMSADDYYAAQAILRSLGRLS